MNDRELADRILGIFPMGVRWATATPTYQISDMESLTDDKFVRDPRIAMALMEKVVVEDEDTNMDLGWFHDQKLFYAMADNGDYDNRGIHKSDSLPRAIIEACVEALTDSQ